MNYLEGLGAFHIAREIYCDTRKLRQR
jgi:hypothetical protein